MKKLIFLVLTFVLSGCSGLLFHPEKEIVLRPSRLGLPYDDFYLDSADGVRLNAWRIPAYCDGATPCPAKANILYLHGNAENISTHTFSVLWLVLYGYNLIALDYRGFGDSDGSVSLSGAEKDVQAAIAHLVETDPDTPLFVFGQSIGAAITVSAVAKSLLQNKIAGVVIDSAFAKARRIAREKVAQIWLLWPFQYPLSFLVPENDAEGNVAKITVPKLFLTTEDDIVVPPDHTRRLYAKAVQPKELEIVAKGGHIRALNNEHAKDVLLRFLNKYTKMK